MNNVSALESWPDIVPKIQAVSGHLRLDFRLGVARGANIVDTHLIIPITRIDSEKVNAFVKEVANIVDKYTPDEIPF